MHADEVPFDGVGEEFLLLRGQAPGDVSPSDVERDRRQKVLVPRDPGLEPVPLHLGAVGAGDGLVIAHDVAQFVLPQASEREAERDEAAHHEPSPRGSKSAAMADAIRSRNALRSSLPPSAPAGVSVSRVASLAGWASSWGASWGITGSHPRIPGRG